MQRKHKIAKLIKCVPKGETKQKMQNYYYYLNLINSDLKEEKDKEEVISGGREFQSEIELGINE